MPWDFALIVLLLGVLVPWRSAVRMRQLLRLPATTSQQRLMIYAGTIAAQWLVAGVALWRALARGIPARALGLALDRPAPTLAVAVPLCGMMAALQIYGLRRLAHLPAGQQGFAGVLARKLMPQNFIESLAFMALAATVGVCEEFLYRGFLLAALVRAATPAAASIAGAAGVASAGALGSATAPGAAAFAPGSASTVVIIFAVVISTLLFAIGHLYQGARGVISTFFLGLLFCGLRVATGSLVPGAALHFGIDLVAGLAAPRLLTRAGPPQNPAPGAGSVILAESDSKKPV